MIKNVMAMAFAATALTAAAPAMATVVNFDDLTGSGVVADGYQGITWGGNFAYYDSPQFPYTASSPNTRIYANYALHDVGTDDGLTFSFAAPVTFQGFYTAGAGTGTVSYDLFLGGSLVGTSASVVATGVPAFVGNSYGGLVDSVVIHAIAGYSVYDDITFNGSLATPEPATWAMMVLGFGLVGGALRRRQSVSVRYA